MSLNQMTSQELAQIVINGEKLFILDVRNTDEFDDWKIEGKGIECFLQAKSAENCKKKYIGLPAQ